MPQLSGMSSQLETRLLRREGSPRVERPERVNTCEQLDGTQAVLTPCRQTRSVQLPRDAGIRQNAVLADIESVGR